MNNKQIGYLLIGLGIAVIVLMLIIKADQDHYIEIFTTEHNGSCFLPDGTCLHETRNFLIYIIGSVLSVGLILLGAYLAFVSKQADIPSAKKLPKKALETLDPEEKKLIEQITLSEGTIFQSELVEKTGFTKVKITRILDKLEGKGLIERKRRGMTNVVILKS